MDTLGCAQCESDNDKSQPGTHLCVFIFLQLESWHTCAMAPCLPSEKGLGAWALWHAPNVKAATTGPILDPACAVSSVCNWKPGKHARVCDASHPKKALAHGHSWMRLM